MAKAKRKTLPTDFSEILEKGSFEEQKAVFEQCALNAYERGYSHDTALHQYGIGEQLVRYLVSEGLHVDTVNAYGRTPLMMHSSIGSPLVAVFIELGADVNHCSNDGNTALFSAIANARVNTVDQLLAHGANVEHQNQQKLNALEYGLSLCSNASICQMLQCAQLLLNSGLKVTPNMQESVELIGQNFERFRSAFNKDRLEQTDAALNELYRLFDVKPVAKHINHDGTSLIEIKGTTNEEQLDFLWDYLVPPSGPAKTLQGEVIRIAGRIRDEFYRNGGANWDKEYRSMLNALVKHLHSHTALDEERDLATAKEIAHQINAAADFDESTLDVLNELALKWVKLNLCPIALDKPSYNR